MNSRTKLVLYEHLPKVIRDPSFLGDFLSALEHSQLRALLEVVTGAGMDEVGEVQPDTLVLWNPRKDDQVTYQLSGDQEYIWDYQSHFASDRGPVPKEKIIALRDYKGPNRWKLHFDYYRILNQVYPSSKE